MKPLVYTAPPGSVRSETCEVLFNALVAGMYRHLAVGASGRALAAKAGQFFQLLCPGQGSGNHTLRRPMSVYRIDRARNRIEFLYKVVGTGTRALAGLKAGDDLDLFGPLGRGFWLEDGWRHIVLLGRGAGLATLGPLAEAAIIRGMAVTAVVSAACPELVLSAEHLRKIGAEVIVATDNDGSSDPERVEALLRRLAADRGIDLIATCGSSRLQRLAQRLGRDLGIAGQVALEQAMACGIGMCFCCVRPFRVDGETQFLRVCHEGPVFDIQEALA
jgi:dihydroorotate dehydrogenase electron transfer subunit